MTRRRRAQPEQQIQRAIVAHLSARGSKNMFWFSIPNGGHRRPVEAAIMKATGTRPGVPDMAFIHEGRIHFLEIKTEVGRPTEHQLKAISDINDAGGFAVIGCGLDRCLQILERWGILKGCSSS
jgi:hypothetical protein